MQLTLRYAVQSERGLRENNEDAGFASPRVLAVADGMGGHAAGEVAASIAIAEMKQLSRRGDIIDHATALRDAVERANAAIADRAYLDESTHGMGTTLTAMMFSGRHVTVAHIGDSRAYLLRDGRLVQITRDDSYVQTLVDEGRLSAAGAARHPQRNIVTNVLTGRDLGVHVEIRESDPGDRYLICSDGLSDYVPAEVIAEALAVADPLRCPQELIRRALQHGSQDNITCVVGDVVAGESGYDIAITAGAPGPAAMLVRA